MARSNVFKRYCGMPAIHALPRERTRRAHFYAFFGALLLSFVVAASAAAPARPSLRVCVLHDAGGAGSLHAIMLENLLGHFREASVHRIEITAYRRGGLSACDRAAYIGSDFGAKPPDALLDDVAAYGKPFLWLNYGIWRLEGRLGAGPFARKTGFSFLHARGTDDAEPGRVPHFYRYFDYKGVRLTKLAAFDGETLIAAPEIMLVRRVDAVVLSTAIHSGDGRTTPYVLRKGNFFYVADNPFQFIHPQDRYLIAADLLFDFLALPPRATVRPAVVRLEDVHPNYDLRLLYRTVALLKSKNVPFAVSLIPKYVAAGQNESDGVDLNARPAFLKAMRWVQDNGGELLLHGYTHDVADVPSCASLGTGAGYEFWDRCRRAPLEGDSADFARERVVSAKRLLVKAGLSTVAWVTPHYAASPADYTIFGRYFERVLQRVCYSIGGKNPGEPSSYVSQFFPYTIYRDQYGQYVWPENLGFVPMPSSDWGYDAPGDIAEAARAMSVVRDSWASFYWHPQLITRRGEAERLSRIIDSLRASGYEFMPLKTLRALGE